MQCTKPIIMLTVVIAAVISSAAISHKSINARACDLSVNEKAEIRGGACYNPVPSLCPKPNECSANECIPSFVYTNLWVCDLVNNIAFFSQSRPSYIGAFTSGDPSGFLTVTPSTISCGIVRNCAQLCQFDDIYEEFFCTSAPGTTTDSRTESILTGDCGGYAQRSLRQRVPAAAMNGSGFNPF